jgi:rubredoxin
VAQLAPGKVRTDGYIPFACPECGSGEFRFEDPKQGEIGERFSLRRRPGAGETMWRFSGAGLPSLKGVQGRVVCCGCQRVFDAETGTETTAGPCAREEPLRWG